MTEKSTTPQIRFKEFRLEWEGVTLESLGRFQGGGTPTTSIEDYWIGSVPWISSSDLVDGDIKNINISKFINETAIQKSATKIIPQGSILFVARVGVGKLAIASEDLCTSQDFANLILKNDDSYFIGYYFLSKNTLLNKFSQGTSIKGFTIGDLKTLNISTPSKHEQAKIGVYFEQLDKLIEQKEKKYHKLQQFKKAMLGKMFPANGADTPVIRFKGFTDNWQEKELSQLGQILTGSTPSTQNKQYYSDVGIPWVTPTDISQNMTFNSAKFLTQAGIDIARVAPKNTILVTCIASIGKNTILGTLGSFNQQINGLIPNESVNYPYFLFTESVLWSNVMKRVAASGTMQIVNKKEFSELITYTPTIQEQTKIGNYFQKLDKLIDLQQQELEKLKNLKKAFLAKMFV